MTFGEADENSFMHGIGSDEQTSFDVLDNAMEMGINFVDVADVYGQDGNKVGSAGQVYLDNVSGEPEWVSVRTGLFGTKESFVPLNQASFANDRLQVPFVKDQVLSAPRAEPHGPPTPIRT